jgi:hypothetical protein
MIDDAEKWLKENDPDYSAYKKRRHSEYPFHTNWQKFYRGQKEVNESDMIGRHQRRINLGNGNYKIDIKERPNPILCYFK